MSGVIVVTGGSRGIGAAIARLAAERGNGAITYRSDVETAEAVVQDLRNIGVRAVAVAMRADVREEAPKSWSTPPPRRRWSQAPVPWRRFVVAPFREGAL